MKAIALLVFTLLGCSTVSAQTVGAYGQCGGSGYSGSTVCISGYVCTYENAFYSQCVPGTTTLATTTTSSSSTVSSSSSTTTKSTSISSSIPKSTSTGFPSVNGLNFTIDGVTNYYVGTNAYWLPFLTDDSDVDHVLGDIASSGLKILRVWGFNDVNIIPSSGTVWFQLLEDGTATINTGADGLERLDAVVSAAEAYDVKLIIPFVNNWNDYGGMNAYVTAFGGSQTTWYNTTEIQEVYQAYIEAVVSRYSSSSAIFAWELGNEPRCNGCDTSVITDWAATTSAYIKSLDPNHMVTTGIEGFGLTAGSDGSYPYSFNEGTNFTALLSIPTIDFGTIHLYPDSWGEAETWGSSWVSTHGATCAAIGKPCILEEFGVSYNQCAIEAPWQATSLDTAGMAGDMFWQYGDTLSTGESSDDGNTIYYGTSTYSCVVTDHIEAIG
ncbi:putative mannan endo-1,4-beta-mannosidase F [Talaromyces atroroseus]|uniref:mannan endo-1,4-beta-mannosidase n=1 Tax=Talaromyces atroroseus TaxID=1441469 RepID=A0A225A8N1_TALAT|nr:putative mannan endo-1,4-beta-mannosidase F [Talaromyces atroroseus]OKL57012.1 putative mannan endo-1,4-beta-mannosidase F [Talaromyces atroroseus]